MPSKKAQSISINTIIIAAIALAVLVVLFVVFTGRFKVFSEGVSGASLTCDSGCKSVGYSGGNPYGIGTSPYLDCTSPQVRISGRFEGMTEGQVCCCTPK